MCGQGVNWRKNKVIIHFSPWRNRPQWARASSLPRFNNHTQTHHIRKDSSGRVISPTQRPLADNTRLSQETDLHAPGGIRTGNPTNRKAADPHLRPRGHWDRQCNQKRSTNLVLNAFVDESTANKKKIVPCTMMSVTVAAHSVERYKFWSIITWRAFWTERWSPNWDTVLLFTCKN